MKKVKNILNTLNLIEGSDQLNQDYKEQVIATIKELKSLKEDKSKKSIVLLQEATDLIDKIKIENFQGNFTALKEAKFDDDGIIPIKIIEAGWGSSGYYSKEVLEEGASIYTKGTLMFWDHPTLTEDYERPERSLRDLTGTIISEGKFDENGSEGPGVYAEAKVFKQFREVIKDMGNDIGISHVAAGKTSFGEAEGKQGLIVESLEQAFSVDWVTMAGAGGKVAEKFAEAKTKEEENITIESLKKNQPKIIESLRKEIKDAIYGEKDKNKKAKEAKEMSELTDLKEANDKLVKEAEENKKKNDKMIEDNKRLHEGELLREAKVIVESELKDVDLPDITKVRLTESLVNDVVIVEGKIDKDKYKENIKKAGDAEITYISELSESGKIKGMGSSEGGSGDDKDAVKEAKEKLEESFKDGMSEDSAKIAAQGR